MEHFEAHKTFYNQPIHLSSTQQKDPFEVIEFFFTTYELSDIRQTL